MYMCVYVCVCVTVNYTCKVIRNTHYTKNEI